MPGLLAFNDNLGETIPADTPHAVSVSLPTWRANVAYEEGEDWVISKMQCGYPRFFIHKSINRLADTIVAKFAHPDDKAMLFPSHATAQRCLDFLLQKESSLSRDNVKIVHFVPDPHTTHHDAQMVLPRLCAVVYPKEHWRLAKQVWQHTGDGVSSRRAEFCEKALLDGSMVEESTIAETSRLRKGPKRYQRKVNGHEEDRNVSNGNSEVVDPSVFVEERYGRNLSVAFAAHTKLAVRRRIAGSLASDADLHEALQQPEEPPEKMRSAHGFSADDVYLYPTGMSSIFNAHRTMMLARGPLKSIMFGFPYVDTLKILEKWGPGAQFYGFGSEEELDDLERRCEGGEKFLALVCEFPGNPLLKSANLQRIRGLADKYDFGVIVDETIGNFLNVNVLPYADVVVSSLTKIFSGDCNVMSGAAILNPKGRYYEMLKNVFHDDFEDNLFEEDSVFLERNSRDFAPRIARINHTAEAICEVLIAHPKVKQVNYPKHSPSRDNYDACRLPTGGYGGLLSCTFHAPEDAKVFYDHLDTAKGPSLGTNFTLSSPFVVLAHYVELDWAAQYGCEENLIRFSIGLEDTAVLKTIFETALGAIPQ